MKDFPSCFGESGVQIADSSSSSSSSIAAQNLVNCVYKCQWLDTSRYISITWTKSLIGQGLSIGIENGTNQCLCKFDIKPWLFSKRKGFKSVEIGSSLLDVTWDLSSAKFGCSPEPLNGFSLTITLNHEPILRLGDNGEKLSYKKIDAVLASPTEAVFVAKKEHIFGKKIYGAKAEFFHKGQKHDISIECDTSGVFDPILVIRIDGKSVLQVNQLKWKFRGNHTILVDANPVEVFWDLHGWLFGSVMANAVFLFQTGSPAEKKGRSQSISDHNSALHWQGLSKSINFQSQDQGFSLILYAWKNE